MQNTPSASKNPMSGFWPAVDTLEAAKSTAKLGGVTAAIVAVVTAIVAILSLFGVEFASIWALIDAGLFALISFGIFKMSRIAAVLGLLLYLWGQITQMLSTGSMNYILFLLFTLYLVHGVRGTFAYHKLKKEAPEPVIEEA